ncbi:glycosyltransferase, partial [Salmonella enterica subsp. enterica]|nr:glycosyltransferase [Salmonella enterica subsp. enterica serovar Saintpaul]
MEFVGVPVGHHTQPDNFNLEQFEYQVTQPDTELAARMLFFLLEQLDSNYGQWGPQFSAYSPGTALEGLNPVLCTRIAGAVTTLFSRPDFTVSDGGYIQLMNLHRWLALIFAVSLYRHADHIIRNINAAGGGVVDPLTLNGHNLRLFCLCYFPDSQIALQPDVLWQYDRRTVARLFLALISGRALPTPAAHGKREQLLAWLPERLAELDSLDFLPTAVLHDVYMHCSYADLAEKHRIKRSLNDLIRRSLLAGDFADIAVGDNRGQ